MHIRLTLSNTLREQLLLQLHQAYRRGHLRLLKRIHALLYVSEGKPVSEVMAILQLSQQSVYNYVKAFILHGLDSLHYQRPSGRPPKLTKSQKQELCAVIDQGPEAAGYDCGCWTTVLLQDVILTRFGVEYNPHYLAELLGTLGYSYQKARFVSDHLAEVAAEQATWLTQTWPTLLARAQAQGAMILFGDECSFAQWGSLSYTWAKRCQQPEVKTSGKRKAYTWASLTILVERSSIRLKLQSSRARPIRRSFATSWPTPLHLCSSSKMGRVTTPARPCARSSPRMPTA